MRTLKNIDYCLYQPNIWELKFEMQFEKWKRKSIRNFRNKFFVIVFIKKVHLKSNVFCLFLPGQTQFFWGSALHSGSIRASHPAGLCLNLGSRIQNIPMLPSKSSAVHFLVSEHRNKLKCWSNPSSTGEWQSRLQKILSFPVWGKCLNDMFLLPSLIGAY